MNSEGSPNWKNPTFNQITLFIVIVILGICFIYFTYILSNAVASNIEKTEKLPSIDMVTLITLVLALFSIFLSAQFYHMATKQSDSFYLKIFDHLSNISQQLAYVRIYSDMGSQIFSDLKDILKLSESGGDSTEIIESTDKKLITEKIDKGIQLFNMIEGVTGPASSSFATASPDQYDFPSHQIQFSDFSTPKEWVTVHHKSLKDTKKDKKSQNEE